MKRTLQQIIGIDLAWGERKPDGLCVLELTPAGGRILETRLSRGDENLLKWISSRSKAGRALLAFDAPIVCPNLTGARPVDRLTHVHFGRFYAGCHPANATKCPRPARLAKHLEHQGFRIGWALDDVVSLGLMAEVYPHPAMVRFFGLKARIPYKRGTVAMRGTAFALLQKYLRQTLRIRFPELICDSSISDLLQAPWTKNIEDQTDALVCALIGYWHWRHGGAKTQVLGDVDTGFILIPTI